MPTNRKSLRNGRFMAREDFLLLPPLFCNSRNRHREKFFPIGFVYLNTPRFQTGVMGRKSDKRNCEGEKWKWSNCIVDIHACLASIENLSMMRADNEQEERCNATFEDHYMSHNVISSYWSFLKFSFSPTKHTSRYRNCSINWRKKNKE